MTNTTLDRPKTLGTGREFPEHQRRIIGELVLSGKARRSEMAELLGFSPQTMMRAVNPLVEAGIVAETEEVTGERGKPPRQMSLKPNTLLTLGITLSQGRTIVELADLTGKSISRASVIQPFTAASAQMDALIDTIHEVCLAKSDTSDIVSAAVVSQGYFLRPGRTVVAKSDPKGWASIDLKETLERETGIPFTIVNDGSAFAASLLAKSQSRNYLAMVLGSGIGGGIVCDGQHLKGAFGNAGEFGRLFAETAARPTETSLLRKLGLQSWAEWHGLSNATDIQQSGLNSWMAENAQSLRVAFSVLVAVLDFDTVYLGSRMPVELLERLAYETRKVPFGLSIDGEAENLASTTPKILAVHVPKFSLVARQIAADYFVAPDQFAAPFEPTEGQKISRVRAKDKN